MGLLEIVLPPPLLNSTLLNVPSWLFDRWMLDWHSLDSSWPIGYWVALWASPPSPQFLRVPRPLVLVLLFQSPLLGNVHSPFWGEDQTSTKATVVIWIGRRSALPLFTLSSAGSPESKVKPPQTIVWQVWHKCCGWWHMFPLDRVLLIHHHQ